MFLAQLNGKYCKICKNNQNLICLYIKLVEFFGKSNEIVLNAVFPVSFMQIRLKTIFYN